MLQRNNKVLFILKNSKNSTNGFYLMNQMIDAIDFEDYNMEVTKINLYSYSTKIKPLDYILTIIKMFVHGIKICISLIFNRPKIVYFTISPVKTFLRDLYYVFLFKVFAIPVVYHLHGKGIKEKYEDSKFFQKLYRWAYKNVSVVALSEKLAFDFDFLPIKSYLIVPNVIEDCSIVKNNRIERTHLEVIFISNLIISKGVDDFIQSVKLAFDEGVNIKATIVGKERDYNRTDINNMIADYGDLIRYVGPLYNTSKFEMLSKCDILVFPTSNDTWGLVILEAMQLGLAVITTDEGATTDMIEDGVNGFIIDKHNP